MIRTYNGVTHTVVYRQGYMMDARTARYFDTLNSRMPGGVKIVQGSFNTSVDLSANTHAGPGALDIRPANYYRRNLTGYRLLERLAREQGGAAWFREWSGNWHVHLILLGTSGLPSVARQQITAYFNYRDGLVSNYRMYGSPINITYEQFLAKQSGGTTGTTTPVSTNILPPSDSVKAMEKAIRIKQDGILDQATDVALLRVKSAAREGLKWFAAQPSSVRKQVQAYVGATQDGLWGEETKSKIKETVTNMQKVLGVPADGDFGPVTYTEFNRWRAKWGGYPYGPFPYPSGTDSRYGVSTAGKPWYSGKTGGTKLNADTIRLVIKRIQKKVGASPDGIYGTATRDKVKAFQKKNGLYQDGIVGPSTWNKMSPV